MSWRLSKGYFTVGRQPPCISKLYNLSGVVVKNQTGGVHIWDIKFNHRIY